MEVVFITVLVVFFALMSLFVFSICMVSGQCSRKEEEKELEMFFEKKGIERREDTSE